MQHTVIAPFAAAALLAFNTFPVHAMLAGCGRVFRPGQQNARHGN